MMIFSIYEYVNNSNTDEPISRLVLKYDSSRYPLLPSSYCYIQISEKIHFTQILLQTYVDLHKLKEENLNYSQRNLLKYFQELPKSGILISSPKRTETHYFQKIHEEKSEVNLENSFEVVIKRILQKIKPEALI